MGKLTATLLTCLFILSPTVVLSETMNDLVEREGLYYKKFSDVPFTGEVTGKYRGKIRRGKWDGTLIMYWDNGQILAKMTWSKGLLQGPYKSYHRNGGVAEKKTYKDGKQHGPLVRYFGTGQLQEKTTFQNGKKHGPHFFYHTSGWLLSKGTYKHDKREGRWEIYNLDGTVNRELTGTYNNGKKVSD